MTRTRTRIAFAALAAVALFAVAALVWGLKSPAGQQSTAATASSGTHVVTYEADGAGARGLRTARYTVRTSDGGTSQGETNLPMKNQDGGTGLVFPGFQPGAFVYLSVQNADAAGSVTCRIKVDGTVISENTSTGGYVIATCQGSVPK
jgi:hypothetical protein